MVSRLGRGGYAQYAARASGSWKLTRWRWLAVALCARVAPVFVCTVCPGGVRESVVCCLGCRVSTPCQRSAGKIVAGQIIVWVVRVDRVLGRCAPDGNRDV